MPGMFDASLEPLRVERDAALLRYLTAMFDDENARQKYGSGFVLELGEATITQSPSDDTEFVLRQGLRVRGKTAEEISAETKARRDAEIFEVVRTSYANFKLVNIDEVDDAIRLVTDEIARRVDKYEAIS